MLNISVIEGRMVKDAELRKTANGTSVCSFTVACDRDRKDENGNRATDFVDVVAWRTAAEFVANYAKKGNKIRAIGRLQSRNWQDKNGNKRINWEIEAENVYVDFDKKTDDVKTYEVKTELEEIPEDGDLPF